ncbi:MAG: glycosyltransferase family 4 protein [Ornithinimicrobium sp.]
MIWHRGFLRPRRSQALGRAPAPDRVLLVSRIFAPESAAAAFRLSALHAGLEAAGARVDVLTSRVGGDAESMAEVSGPDCGRIRRWPVLRDVDGYVRGYLPYLSFDLPLVLRLVIARRPDVVIVEPPPTTGAVVRTVLAVRGRLRRQPIPYVYYAADVWSDASASTAAPAWVVHALRVVERYALEGAADVIAVSPGVADRVRALGARSVTVVPNGVDTTVFDRLDPVPQETAAERCRLGIPSELFLLYAGTASEWQGAEIFAEAMREVSGRIPWAKLIFLGQGSSWPALQRIAGDLPSGSIELRSVVLPGEVAIWHRAASAALVSVRPGIGYDFAYPTKVLAALACGTPVIYAGPGPAADDLVEQDLGTVVPYGVDAVAEAMLAALRVDPDESASQRRAQWVGENRSITATGAAAARAALGAAVSR